MRRSVLSALGYRPSPYHPGVSYLFTRGMHRSCRLANGASEDVDLRLNAPFEAGETEGVSITAPSHRAGTIFLAAIAGNLPVFPDWPLFAAVGIALLWIGRGPLARAPHFVRRLIKLFVAFLFLCAFVRLIVWGPFWWLVSPLGLAERRTGPALLGVALLAWFLPSIWIFFSRSIGAVVTVSRAEPISDKVRASSPSAPAREIVAAVPSMRFSDLGGMENAKQQIREVVESQLNSKKYKRYGVVRNGILLHGPGAQQQCLSCRRDESPRKHRSEYPGRSSFFREIACWLSRARGMPETPAQIPGRRAT